MLQATNIPEFKYIPSVSASYWNRYLYKGYSWDFEDDEFFKCSKCGNLFEDYEMVPVVGLDGNQKYFCPDCCVAHVNWCVKCGEAFEIKEKSSEKLCPTCRHEKGGNEKCITKKSKKNSMK